MSDTNPTPLERLEKWRVADSGRNWCMKSIGRQTYYAASLTEYGCVICSGTGDTLDAAILAALVQAEEKTHE